MDVRRVEGTRRIPRTALNIIPAIGTSVHQAINKQSAATRLALSAARLPPFPPAQALQHLLSGLSLTGLALPV